MTKLRQAARGMPCLVRLQGICNHNTETTVLAHYRMAGLSGTGAKPPDLIGSWCCSACHDAIDGRVKVDMTRDELQLEFARGVFRTQNVLLKKGLVKA